MEYVTIVNRTSNVLQGTWDGRQYVVAPGESMHPRLVANAIKRQNPLMGSQGTEIYDIQYLCGIKEDGDDITPLEQSDAIELMDSRLLHPGKNMHVVPGISGMYRTRQAVAAELPTVGRNQAIESGFEKP